MSSTPSDPRTSSLVFPPDRSSKKSQTFLQALSDTMHDSKQDGFSTCTSTYIHPLVSKLSAKLSDKSLEMCTESLGSETGSDIINDPMIISPSMVRQKEITIVAKTKREYNFPPPLTSFDDSISVESYRENGRLVMNAVVITETSDSLFLAERVNGRLTLRLKMGGLGEADDTDEEFGIEKKAEDKDLIGNIETLEGNIGIDENMSRLGRCNKADGKRRGEGHLWNMETCWVAT